MWGHYDKLFQVPSKSPAGGKNKSPPARVLYSETNPQRGLPREAKNCGLLPALRLNADPKFKAALRARSSFRIPDAADRRSEVERGNPPAHAAHAPQNDSALAIRAVAECLAIVTATARGATLPRPVTRRPDRQSNSNLRPAFGRAFS